MEHVRGVVPFKVEILDQGLGIEGVGTFGGQFPFQDAADFRDFVHREARGVEGGEDQGGPAHEGVGAP